MDNTAFNSLAGRDNRRIFDDPFLLTSNDALPDTIDSILDFALFLYYMNPQYRQASSRVVSHFITDIDYPGDGSKDEKDEYDEYLHYQLQVLLFMQEMGDEVSCYGNGFARIHFPFDRFLVDPRGNGKEYSLDIFGNRAKYDYKTMTYEVPDPLKSGSKVKMKFWDRKSLDQSRIKLRKINPRQMLLRHNLVSGTTKFVYRFEPPMIDEVKKGRLHIVNEMPLPMLKAIKENNDFLFDSDTVFHFKAPTISGISNYGWGMPGTVANFRNIYQLQVYRKIDEAVGLDYMLPFRLFSPLPQQGINEAMSNIINARWATEVGRIIDNRRRDKFAMHAVPFPVQYQEFGYTGKEIAPWENVEYCTKLLLDGMGYPQELFNGTLQYVQVPTALRLFENSFQYIQINFNQMLQWISRKVRGYLNQPRMKVELQEPSLADSLEKKQLIFQLAAMGEISRETAWDGLGVDNVVGEFKKRLEEDSAREKMQARMQQELQKEIETGSINAEEPEAQQGNMPGIAAPGAAPQGGQSVTPLDTQNQAQGLAQYWLSLPDGQRRQVMEAARSADPQTHALAKEVMESMRRQGSNEGRQAVNQQFQGGGGAR